MKAFPSPVTAALSANMFLTGVSFAAAAPYRAIIAIDGLAMSNTTYAVVMTLSSIGTATASLTLGYFADGVSDRRLLVIACAFLGALAYGTIYLFPTQPVYIFCFCVVLPFGGALFSQSFSFSRAYYDHVSPKRSEFMVSALRSIFASAWIIVPPIAGWIASSYTVFDVFAVAAVAHVGCTIIFALLLADPQAKIGRIGNADRLATHRASGIPAFRVVGIGGVTLVRIALTLHVTAMPLILITDFGGSLGQVGINASIAAALEVPCMLAWGVAASRMSKETILIVNAVIYAVYLALIYFAQTVTDVYWLQTLNAISTAALLSITISYMQEAIKGRVGLSTSLMDVVTVVSAFVAAAVFASFSSAESYILVFVVAGALSLVGAALIAVSKAMPSRLIDL